MYLSSISLWLLQRDTLVAVSISLFEILMFPQSIFSPKSFEQILYYVVLFVVSIQHALSRISYVEQILDNLVVWNSNLKVYEPNPERLNFLLKSVTIYRKQRFSSIEEIVGVKHLILWATYLII